jgi:hypothetical protein
VALTRFSFRRGYASFKADFARPFWDLFQAPVNQRLFERLLERLAPFGLSVSGLKVNNGDGDLGAAHISGTLSDATLRIGFERLEMETFRLEILGGEGLSQLITSAAESIVEVLASNPYRTYQVDVGLHGALVDTTPREFIARYMGNQPELRGPHLGAGCWFYYGADEQQLTSEIALEQSTVVDGGLFVRKRTAWIASKVPLAELTALANREVEDAFSVLGLELDRG